MTVSFWRPSHLTRAQQEERRLAAQSALTDPGRTTRDLAQQFGVAEVTIRVWRARLRRDGEDALRASRATGRPHHLTVVKQEEIGVIIDGDPRVHGFESTGKSTAAYRLSRLGWSVVAEEPADSRRPEMWWGGTRA